MKEAMYYKKLDKNYVRCNLCPHNCIIKNGDTGICRARKNEKGRLYTLNFGKISGYGYDAIEKKPLYHFYPGSAIFSIGSFGCNLSCEFCQNYKIVYDSSYSQEIDEDSILLLAEKNNSIGIAFTYNEPSIWYEYMLHMSKKIKEKKLKNIMVTNGYINKEPLIELLPYIDAMNIDLKSMKNSFYKDICNGSLEPVLKTIELAAKKVHVEVTTLLIEGANSELAQIEELGKKIASIDKSIPLHISRYFPAYKMKLPATNIEILFKARDILNKYLEYVYIGNVFDIDINTYCPNCGKKIVDRGAIKKIVGLDNGRCINCNKSINIKY